ncbi:RnfABCDGE type electron transport complex subunit D [Candidatus Parabeggiatoa sp. HSG14]|uniref:RnfABCDGE type electron transport complex subunit D n=1 Tax=Candidatus Parabeggiatoa sp. HSG14 TaxID=3055593 RepID=UPI0025A864CD|nr:RnfABCDGE type electron transport complex subunit D [Thiotrichales bacterium HSG14]
MRFQFYLSQIWQSDPRYYQITILSLLLIYGITRLNFEVEILSAFIIISTALLTQFFCTRFFKLPYFDFRSPLISSLSLCLLLRTNLLLLMSLTAIITILSKFIFRWNNKHIFNPTTFGLVTMMLLTGQVWVSPGQWGSTAFFGFLMACFGGMVINRAARSDVTFAFLFFYIAILFGRALWLGDPLTIPLHQLENGALLLFAFFMISDPKTTPDSRAGRILFAFLVALGANFIYFWLYRTNGLFWSLAFFGLFVPLIDWLLPGKRYQWK